MKFNNRFYYLLLITFALFLLAKGLEKYNSPARLLDKYAKLVESDLQKHEKKILLQLSNQPFIQNRFYPDSSDIQDIESLSKNHFNICLYNHDSLIFWSNTIAFPDTSLLKEIKNSDKPIFKKLSNGYFAIQKYELPLLEDDQKYAISLIPVKWIYKESIKHLRPHFEAGGAQKIPQEIAVSQQVSKNPVRSIKGITLFYLKETAAFKDKSVLRWLLFTYIMGFVFLGVVTNKFARELINHTKPWIGPAFLLAAVFGIRYLSLDWSSQFEDFLVFSRSFENPHVSVGDLLINTILLLWVVIFIHRESKDKDFKANFSAGMGFFLTMMNYLSVVLALLLLISVLKSLVLTSDIALDFKNVFNLDQYSVIAVLGVILLLFTQFIFSHRMMITINKLNLPRKKRLLALGLAILLALPIIHYIDLQIPLHISALLSFIFILTYDLFIDVPNPGLVWLVGWVILFAAVSSGLLYNYNIDKEIKNELNLAKILAEERDTFAENAIFQFNAELEATDLAIAFPEGISSLSSKATKLFSTLLFNQNYLYTNYDCRTYVVEQRAEGRGQRADNLSVISFQEWQAKINSASSVNEQQNVYFHHDKQNNYSYFLQKEVKGIIGKNKAFQLIFEFKKAARKRPKVYTNLLARQEFKNLDNLSNFDYAIIKNGNPIVEQGIYADEPVFKKEPSIGGYVKSSNEDKIHFMYRSGEKDYVILSKPKNNLFHPISLFSFLFGFLAVMVLLFALVNSKLAILPDNFNFHFWNKPSLKNRIQFSTIFLTLVSFIIIGFVSVYFLRTSYISYDKSRLNRKVSSVLTASEQYLRLGNDSLGFLKEQVFELSKAERIDVNLFDLKGQLIQSSEMDIYKRGILPPKMNAYAFEYLDKIEKSDFVQIEEAISGQSFTSAFVPVKNSKGKKLAYLGTPYSNQQRTLQNDVSSFMGNLLNVYVFLLLIAGGSSVYVANTITKPITAIGENLKELKLGNPNEPLQWRTNDEIGALITEYNRMILKLEHSAKLLARSEREGAWREMAKQVAHEIKNPLTPMKLSIQYLQHAFKSSPDNIEPLLKRVSHTLIEQIDSLAQIASEFSNFAKMPRANNQQIQLNDLVETVCDLFKESKNTDVLLSLPDNDFYVFADKSHVVRVLNNMIKNAIEAIPGSRRGKIDVSLYKMDGMAVIKVKDNGIGIPEDMKEKVFVPNFTTKNSGTGLGLAISKNIIESVSGNIYFETEKDVGTNFYVELPLEEMII